MDHALSAYLMVLLVALFAIGVGVAMWLHDRKLRGAFEGFARKLKDPFLVLPTWHPFMTADSRMVAGEFEGRPVQVNGVQRKGRVHLRCSVPFTGLGLDVKILPVRGRPLSGGVVTGDLRLDAKYVIRGQAHELLERVGARELESTLDALFEFTDATGVRIADGKVVTDLREGDDRDLRKAFPRLLRLARKLGLPEVTVRSESSRCRVRCPYCHDDLNEAQHVACSACGTRHHAECYREAGGCTIHGCIRRPHLVAV